MCIRMHSGVEIWVEKEKAQKLISLIGTTQTKFVEVENEIINSASIEGVFSPETMEELAHRKNGEWVCDYGAWHKRNDQCGHDPAHPYSKKY